MTEITLISEKGSALSCEELDANFMAVRELQDKSDESTARLVGAGSGAIKILDISNADFSEVDVDKPIAYLQIGGYIRKIFDDGYGNPAEDGYGNMESERVDVDILVGVYVDDDGYGNINLRSITTDSLSYAGGDKQLILSLEGDYLGVFNVLDVSINPLLDFEKVGIEIKIGAVEEL